MYSESLKDWYKPVRVFELTWKDGRTEIIKGYSIADAFDCVGYNIKNMRKLGLFSWKQIK